MLDPSEPSSTQAPLSDDAHSASKMRFTNTPNLLEEETPAKDCAWPLPITPMNTLGLKGKNKVSVGQVFGRLQVVEAIVERPKVGRRPQICLATNQWKCKCSCGKEKVVTSSALNVGDTRSCGCLRSDMTREKSTKHGHSPAFGASKTYWVWAEMVARCTNEKHKRYKDYGGRGIFVCKEWRTFAGFLADMGEKPEGLSIDRIDNNGGYEPGNCRWTTVAVQNQNRRDNTLNWDLVNKLRSIDLPYKDLEKRFGIHYGTIGKVKRNEIWVDPDYIPSRTRKRNKPYV